MAYQFQNPSQDVIFDYVKRAKTIAIVGLSARKETAAYDVAQVLQSAGYVLFRSACRIFPNILILWMFFAAVTF